MYRLWQRIRSSVHIRSFKFFRGRLLILNADEVSKIVDQMEKEANAIRKDALKMTWNLRGGLSYDQAMALSFAERNIIGEIIKEHAETTKKTGLPYF